MVDVEAPSGKIDGGSAFQLWNVSLGEGGGRAAAACARRVSAAVLFSVHYWRGGSNNYHLHWDTLIPLYAMLRRRGYIMWVAPRRRRGARACR